MKNQDSRKDRPKSCNITISPACRRSRAPRRAPMPRSSRYSPFSEAPGLSAEVCKSRFIAIVSVPGVPKGPQSHDPRDVHRFQSLQDCPWRSPSHDLSGLSAFQKFQKGPPSHDPRDIHRFRSSKIVPRGPRVTIYRACRCSRASRRAPKPRSSRHSSFSESPRLSPEVPKSRFIGPVDVLEPPEGGPGSYPDA